MDHKNERRVVLQFFHPFRDKSVVNRSLLEAARQVKGLLVRDLYEIYPDFCIDVEEEQRILVEHDVVVFQHPIYWHSCPSLMKEWMDAVLEHGWAYGTDGTHLREKGWMQAITTGSPADAYTPSGYNEFPLLDLLRPFERTARLCNMNLLTPFITHAASTMTPDRLEQQEKNYQITLESLLRGKTPPPYTTSLREARV